MSKKPINISVCKKVRFNNEENALFSLKKITTTSTRKVVPIRAYLCQCGAWHLTSRPDSFALLKENELLKLEIAQQKEKIKELTSFERKIERVKVRADERVKEQRHVIQSLQKRLKEARNDRNNLIAQLHSKNNPTT